MGTTINILACDPGLRNFGLSVIQMRLVEDRLAFRVLENAVIPYTITQIQNSQLLRAEGIEFTILMENYLQAYDIDLIAAERYMSRGMGGVTIEVVNMMLGWIMLAHTHLPQRVISAATWKNAVRRKGVELKDFYMQTGVAPHQLDATLIGVFIGALALKQPNFGNLNLAKLMPALLRQLEETSTSKLTKRKGR